MVMRLTGFGSTTTRNHRKHTEKSLKNAEHKSLLKTQRLLNTEIQANRGAHFLYLAWQGGHPFPPVSYATDGIGTVNQRKRQKLVESNAKVNKGSAKNQRRSNQLL